jgi:hypothetical protein
MFKFSPPQSLITDKMVYCNDVKKGVSPKIVVHSEWKEKYHDMQQQCKQEKEDYKMIFLSSKEEKKQNDDLSKSRVVQLTSGDKNLKSIIQDDYVPKNIEELSFFTSTALKKFADHLKLLEKSKKYKRNDYELIIMEHFSK